MLFIFRSLEFNMVSSMLRVISEYLLKKKLTNGSSKETFQNTVKQYCFPHSKHHYIFTDYTTHLALTYVTI